MCEKKKKKKRKERNCITEGLKRVSLGVQMKIFYNSEHCIGVSEKKIYDLGNNFKKELLKGCNLKYTPIEDNHNLEAVIRSFEIKEQEYIEQLKKYYESLCKR